MLVVNKRPDRKITDIKRIQDSLILYSEDGLTKLEPKSPDIIRIVYTQKDTFSSQAKPGVIYDETFSGWDYKENGSEISLNTGSLSVVIDKNTASLTYYDHKGKLLLGERDYESKNLEEFDSFQTVIDENTKVERIVTPDGIKEVVKGAAKVFDRKLYRIRLYLTWQEGEALYGLGQHEEGHLNLRGTTVYVHQANKKIGIPVLVSSLGYGILMDTYSPMIFNDTNAGSYLYTEADTELDYYFIHGGNLDGVVRGYRKLTGKAVMLPKWAFGFIQSQERYETAEELINIVAEHRNRKVGLDGIVLDWCSWEGDLWGQKTFDRERFADPAAMMEQLHNNHAKLMLSVWPNMSKDCDNYKDFEKEQLLLPASSIYDPFREEGRKLYWKQVEKGLFCFGIDAWWCDSSEPFTPEWNHLGRPEPGTMYHEFYDTASQYMKAELTNSYGLFHARAIYEGQRGETEEKRVLNLTRNGYTGQQRYGAVLWSGDISADWTTMRRQIAAGLNFCASGIPYWTLDIGAFFVKKGVQWFWDGGYEQGYEDLGYRELFTRWFQYGCFLPMFRSHGTDFRRELWNFGEPGSIFYDALIKMNQLRYRLMPYIYSLAAKVWREDYTMFRLLAFDFPRDVRVNDIDDQFLFGDSLMICPVTQPMYYDKNSKPVENMDKTRQVYLPAGTGWYDFWTEQYYEGGQVITAAAPIDIIPVYVKAGSIIPMTDPMQYVDEIPEARVEVRVYPGRAAEYELYEDEGDSYRYEKGEYTITKMTWSEESRKLKISEPSGSYAGMVKNRIFEVKVVYSR